MLTLPTTLTASIPRLSWQLRRWLLPIALIFAQISCSLHSGAPATLQPQRSTATFTPDGPLTPTPSLPAGVVADRPLDPAIKELLDQVQSDRLMVAVGSLVDMQTRHVLSKPTAKIGGISGARDWLLSQFNDLKKLFPDQNISAWTQNFQYKWNGFNISADNVVAVFQGTDVGAGVIVLGAHYDSISSNFTNGQAYAPGANDNASGVAAMLETARILAPQSHRATIIFVAFAAEETGRQGSLAFVKSYLQALDPPVDLQAMINLDIVGSEMGANGEIDKRTIRLFSAAPNDSPSRQLARQMTLIIKNYVDEVDPVLQSAEERTGRWGDHQSFRAASYPAMRIIQGLEDTSRQHTGRDTLDNVQPGYLMRTTKAALASVAVLADGPQPPANITLRAAVNNPRMQTLIWTPVPSAAAYLITLRQTSSLYYDRILTVAAAPSPELTWDGFGEFTTVAIAAVDSNGRMGALSPEATLASLRR